MSREILFRGKRVDNNQWTEGFLSFFYTDGKNSNGFIYTDKARIYSNVEVRSHDVYTATVGQFIGLCDKNGVKIFEGDKVWWGWGDHGSLGWEHSGTVVVDMNNYDDLHMLIEQHELEVIGNIYDNPELAEVSE